MFLLITGLIVFEGGPEDSLLHRLGDGLHVNLGAYPHLGRTLAFITGDQGSSHLYHTPTMQKRVHFAPTNTVISPSRTPSPSLSEASLPSDSSSEVSTPPPEVDYDPAHYPRSPFPHNNELVLHPAHYQLQQPQVQVQGQLTPLQVMGQSQDVVPKSSPEPGHMQIHYLLAYTPHADIPVFFDLSLNTKEVIGHFLHHEFLEAATNPPLPSLAIHCPLLAWEITVAPLNGDYVTVNDVLHCLYRHLRLAVTPEEYEALATGLVREAVNSAYRARCARIEDPQKRATEKGKGVKRIDFLQGRNVFKGLSGTLTAAHIWELNVATAVAAAPVSVATAASVI